MRVIFVLVVAILFAFQVIRTATVAKPSHRATIGARLWPSHPSLLIDQTMAEVGAQAARGRPLEASTLRRVDEIARKAPLDPAPFLIKGTLAQTRGQEQLAEHLFIAARSRDPRSAAARYFLAERYLRIGQVTLALAEIAALSRLLPDMQAQFAPALAAYARMPGAVAQLRRFFKTSPELEPAVLATLAGDDRNADLILALWGNRQPGSDAAPPEWQARLIDKQVAAGQFALAYSTWARLAGAGAGRSSLFNPDFRKMAAPAPFNWKFDVSGGVIEPAPGGGIEVIYYGRNDTVLAEQLLLLAPGRYQLAMVISGPLGQGGEIGWTVSCLPRSEPILRLPVDRKGRLAAIFAVPAGCPAQRLALVANAGEFPQSQEFAVGGLSLGRVSTP